MRPYKVLIFIAAVMACLAALCVVLPGRVVWEDKELRWLTLAEVMGLMDNGQWTMDDGLSDEQELPEFPVFDEPVTDNPSPVTDNPSPVTVITLTPKDQSIGINRFVLRVRTADLMPLQAEIKEGKKTSTLKMKEPKFIQDKQDFTLKAEKDTYINDLR